MFKSLEQPVLLGDNSEMEPPDPFPNSEVKRLSADGSVELLHARVGHRQAPNTETPALCAGVFSFVGKRKNQTRLRRLLERRCAPASG